MLARCRWSAFNCFAGLHADRVAAIVRGDAVETRWVPDERTALSAILTECVRVNAGRLDGHCLGEDRFRGKAAMEM